MTDLNALHSHESGNLRTRVRDSHFHGNAGFEQPAFSSLCPTGKSFINSNMISLNEEKKMNNYRNLIHKFV